jgi:hypothetical protein
MVSPVIALCQRRASELSSPDYQRRVKQTPALQIAQKTRYRLVRSCGSCGVEAGEIGVRVVPVLPYVGA